MKRVERIFESGLWYSRLLVLLAVIASLILSVVMFYATSLGVIGFLARLRTYAAPAASEAVRAAQQAELLSTTVEVIDGYLLAIVLLVFALGLYELFINKIDLAENSEFASRLLLIRTFDDLKDRLAKVVVLILVVKFFQIALDIKYTTPVDLLYLGGGVALVGLGLWLTHGGGPGGH